MATVDGLDIQIQASVQKANDEVNRLANNLDKLIGKLSKISNTPIKLNISAEASKDINTIKYSIQKALDNTKIDTSKIGEKLAKSFGIESKKASQSISNQFTGIIENAVNKFDGSSFKISGKAINELAENIARSGKVAKGELSSSLYGMKGEYEDFYNYFKSHKLYVSDFLKTDIGKTEFASILQTNLSNITRDATKGINLNVYWEELTKRFPIILPKNIDNAADQVVTVLQKIGDVRDKIKPISIENLIGSDYSSAVQNIKEKITSSINEAKEQILKDATKIYNTPQDKAIIPVNVNEDAIVKQIQSAIKTASAVKYEPLKIDLSVDTKKVKSDLTEKLKGIDLSELSGAFAQFKNISFDAKPIIEMANAVSILGRKTSTAGIENIPTLTNAVKDMLSAFSGFSAIDSSIVQMTQSLAELSKNGKSLVGVMNDVKNASSVSNIFGTKNTERNVKYLIEYKKELMDFKNDMKSMSDVYGGFQNVPKSGLDTPIQNLKQSIEELKQSYPQATNVISAFEKELQNLQNISAGLTKEQRKINFDTNSIDRINEKIRELKNRFEKAGLDFKFTGNFEQLNIEIEKVYSKLNELKAKEQEMISAGQVNTSGFEQLQESIARVGNKFVIMQDLKNRTEAFNQSLQQLRVPEIREENLAKLQNSLRKTEEETEKLRIKLANAITVGKIIPNIDDSGFRKLAEQITLSEKQAEALKNKIQELGGETSNSGNIMERLKSSLSNVSSQSSKTSSATNILEKNIKKLSSSMSGFGASAGKAITGMKSFARQALSAFGIYLGIYGAIRGIKKSVDIASDLTEIQNVVDVTFGEMAYKVEELAKTSIEQFGMSELSLKQYSSRFQSMGTAMGIGSKSIEKANEFLNKQTKGYVGLSDSMADVSLNLTKLTADMASLYNVDQKVVAEKMASVFTGQTRPLREYGLDLTQATLAEWAMKNGLDANIQSMTQAEKTMLRYQYVMANTNASHGDFARTVNTWANQVRILKENFKQLASVIGGVLVNAFKPVVIAINKAMSGIIAFAKTISNALGKIFGWKYEEGGGASSLPEDFGSAADSADDMADSTGKTAKNVEKIQKGLRAFDELKTISLPDDDSGSGGGGGGTGGGAGGAGAAGGDWIKGKSILKEFESEIDSLYELGKYIGDTLTKALNSIDWDSVYEEARNFGKGLAEFLNGLISPELFSALGRTIANSINTALHFLDSFGETFNWKNFGKSLGDGLNAFMSNLDWKTALSAAKNWGTGIADALNGFLYETSFTMIGKTVANALNTAVQFALDLGLTIDFEMLGTKLANAINGFFEDFDFGALAETLNTWVNRLGKTIKKFIKKIKWKNILSGIGDFFLKLDSSTVATMIGILAIKKFGGKIATAITSTIGQIRPSFKFGLLLEFSAALTTITGTGSIKDTVLSALESTVGTYMITGNLKISLIIGAITVAVNAAVKAANWIGKKLVESILNAKGKDSSKVWEMPDISLSQAIKINIKLKSLNEKDKEDAKKKLSEFLKDTKLEWSIPIIEMIAFDDLEEIGEKLLSPFKLIEDELKEHVAPWFTKEKWQELGQNIKSGLEEKWNEFSTWWQGTGIPNWWNNNVAPWFTKEKWQELGQNIKSGLKSKWNEFSEWWKKTGIYNWWNNNVKPWFEEKKWNFRGIKDGLKSSWNAAIDSIKQIWNKFAGWLNGKLTWTINPIVIAGQTIFDGAVINLGKIPTFAAGGFPEDGWFRANHGEIMGRFDNGQSVVANNNQITEGIAAAVYPAVYNAVSSAVGNSSLLNDILEEVEKGHTINIDGDPVYKKMIKRAKEDMRSGKNGRLVVAEELY